MSREYTLPKLPLESTKGCSSVSLPFGKTHHGLINGGVAVGVQAHGLADDVGGFRPSTGEQTHFVHGVQQLAVRRLEAVDLRNCPGNDDRHGIGHVVQFQRLGNGLLRGGAVQAHNAVGIYFFFFRFLLFSVPWLAPLQEKNRL